MNGQSYAGFWKRVVANIIDRIIIGMASAVILIPLFVALGISAFSMADIDTAYDPGTAAGLIIAMVAAYLIVVFMLLLAGWMYYALMESSSNQGTLGKMALGIKVTDMNGERISFGRATGRYFARYLSLLILGIGFLMAAFTQQKQALHDIIAGCLVVNK